MNKSSCKKLKLNNNFFPSRQNLSLGKADLFGKDILLISYALTVVISGLFHVVLVDEIKLDYLIGAVILLTVGHLFLYCGLYVGSIFLQLRKTELITNSYVLNFKYGFLCSIVYCLIVNTIEIHTLGNELSNSNPMLIEGISELISRYLLPAVGYVALINNSYQKKSNYFYHYFSKYIFPLVIIYSIYIDLFIKLSKQVLITWLLIVILANLKKNFLKFQHILFFALITLGAFSYVTFNRIMSLDEFAFIDVFDVNGPIVFVSEVVYHRLVGIYELTNLLNYGINLYDFKYSISSTYSTSNLYTNLVYGLPLNGGSSSAPGFVGFFLFSFGYIGILGSVLVGISIFAYQYILSILGGEQYSKAISSLLLFLILTDGIIDERLFSIFPLKLLLLHCVLLFISRIRFDI